MVLNSKSEEHFNSKHLIFRVSGVTNKGQHSRQNSVQIIQIMLFNEGGARAKLSFI